jgi:hypothetical protein
MISQDIEDIEQSFVSALHQAAIFNEPEVFESLVTWRAEDREDYTYRG